jgi:hypothetical protein
MVWKHSFLSERRGRRRSARDERKFQACFKTIAHEHTYSVIIPFISALLARILLNSMSDASSREGKEYFDLGLFQFRSRYARHTRGFREDTKTLRSVK